MGGRNEWLCGVIRITSMPLFVHSRDINAHTKHEITSAESDHVSSLVWSDEFDEWDNRVNEQTKQ